MEKKLLKSECYHPIFWTLFTLSFIIIIIIIVKFLGKGEFILDVLVIFSIVYILEGPIFLKIFLISLKVTN